MIACLCSREDVLRKQAPIALGIQPLVEEGDATGALPRNSAEDEGLWAARSALEPLFLDLLPSLSPHPPSSLQASDGSDVDEDSIRPSPIPPFSAPPHTMGKISHRELGPLLLHSR